jgi:hypothetical protein
MEHGKQVVILRLELMRHLQILLMLMVGHLEYLVMAQEAIIVMSTSANAPSHTPHPQALLH